MRTKWHAFTVKTISVTFTLALFAGGTGASRGAFVQIPGLYNTGVDDAGHVLPLHSVDPHYRVSGAASVAYVVPIVFHSPGNQAWVTPPPGSAWIGPNPTDSTWPTDPIGDYCYTLSMAIDLAGTGYDPAALQIAGLWATDNSGQIWVNGQNTGFTTEDWGFTRLSPFVLQGMFRDGLNVLEFRVLNSANSPNPSGLLVANLAAAIDGSLTLPTVPPDTVVPEPSTFIGGALLSLPFVLAGRRVSHRRKPSVHEPSSNVEG